MGDVLVRWGALAHDEDAAALAKARSLLGRHLADELRAAVAAEGLHEDGPYLIETYAGLDGLRILAELAPSSPCIAFLVRYPDGTLVAATIRITETAPAHGAVVPATRLQAP